MTRDTDKLSIKCQAQAAGPDVKEALNNGRYPLLPPLVTGVHSLDAPV
jgi:hypothetical protein